jgi:membrane protein DedA with SNARE-associated domain
VQDFLFNFVDQWSYLGLFLILIAAGLGVPLPEDIPLIASGWMVHTGHGSLTLMILTGLAGVMIGDSLLFNMGRRYGDHVFEHRWFRRIAKPWLIERARLQYAKHGWKILFLARFMPGLRSVLFLIAGAFKVPYWLFLSTDGLAALISVPLWIWAGWHFGDQVEHFMKDARRATYVVLGVLLVCLVIWAIYEYRHNLSAKTAPTAEPLAPPETSAKNNQEIVSPSPRSDTSPLT